MAFSTAYVRRRWVVEIKFGSVCCAWVLLYRENTVKTRKVQSPGRTVCLNAGGDLGLQTRAQLVQRQSLARALEWVAAVAVSGAEEGSADDVVGLAGAPGSR